MVLNLSNLVEQENRSDRERERLCLRDTEKVKHEEEKNESITDNRE